MNNQPSHSDQSPPFEGRWWLELDNAANANLIDMLRPALVSFLAFGKGREPKIAGSGFIMSADKKLAVMITAKHVLEEGVSRAQFEHPTHATSTPAIFRPTVKISLERERVRAVWVGRSSVEMLTVPYVNFATELDLAVCLLLPQDGSTTLEPSVIPLDTAIPKGGEVVHLVSLANKPPDERQYDPKSGLQEIAIERQVVVRRGIVTAVYMEGYRQFRWPCFTVSIPTAPGMSGGFVNIPQDGQTIAACGVVCADVSPHGAESSFLNRGESVIAISSACLLLSIPEAIPWKAGNPSMTLFDAMQGNRIQMAEGGLENVKIIRHEGGGLSLQMGLAGGDLR